MLINLTDVLSKADKVIRKEAELEMTQFQSRLGSFDIVSKEPFTLTISNVENKRLLVEGVVNLTLVIPCDRCLTDVPTSFSLEIEKDIDIRLSEEERIKDLDETEFMIGYNLDVDKLVYGEILVNWPMKTLCDEACKGICKKCGANLNHGTCDCDTVELDPRMAAIRDIFAAGK